MGRVRYAIVCFITCIVLPALVNAAPVWNEPFEFRQPDGSLVKVVVSGDEFYQDVQTPDGYPLVRDPGTQWICYAKRSPDGNNWVSTGIVYGLRKRVSDQLSGKSVQKFARLNPSSILAQRKAKFLELNKITYEQSMREYLERVRALSKEAAVPGSNITPPLAKPDTVYGLTILIDFPDKKSAVPIDSIRNWLNKDGYTGYKCNGSVKDYFFDVSDGKMVYFNECTDFITADNPKSTYDAGTGYGGSTTLITEICAKLKNLGTFDFSRLTLTNGVIRAVNILYAGTADAGWANGLWPHSGTFRYTFATGVQMSAHQMSNIGSSLTLGTIAHENGHMLCKWKDLYAYDNHDNGVGKYCIMCSTHSTNPAQPNGFFRSLMKWITVTDITNDGLGKLYSHEANGHSIYVWSGANTGSAQEAFYIEARRRVGRSATLPDSGLIIWHVDKAGSNTDSAHNDYLMPEQADGLFELEKKINTGKDGDLFHAGYKTEFNDNTTPSAKWHNNQNSGIQIANISAVGPSMTFSLGSQVGVAPGPPKNAQSQLHALGSPGEPRLRYSVPFLTDGRAMVRIDLYNLNGVLVKTLVNESKQSGQTYTVALGTVGTAESKLSQGTYLCTLIAAGVSTSIRIVLK
jgi:M6 family metalloprotease-like protein